MPFKYIDLLLNKLTNKLLISYHSPSLAERGLGGESSVLVIVPFFLSFLFILASCSTTSAIPDGEQLYRGLEKIDYQDYEPSEHFTSIQDELDAALAAAPNGALMGSSFVTSPFPYKLWIWNAFANSEGKLGQWIAKHWGTAPVLMSQVNPALRASVAQSVLRAHGYMRGKVDYESITLSNPKKGKIAYTVHPYDLFTVDSFRYVGYPEEADSLLRATEQQAVVKRGVPFDASLLDEERTRVSTLFRNNGFFYYQPDYSTYLADTLQVPTKAQVQMHSISNIPLKAKHKWYIGKITINYRHNFLDSLTEQHQYRNFLVRYNGKRPPVRNNIIRQNLTLKQGELYNYEAHQESAYKINMNNVFSMVSFNFTPRDSSATCDTLDLQLNCVLDKPYDFYVEGNVKGKTSGRLGPELVMGLTKRNAFRGGEQLDINVNGSYEWQTGHNANGNKSEVNSYEYGMSASLEFPRLVTPSWLWRRITGQKRKTGRKSRRRFYTTPSTIIKASSDVLNRAGYFKRHVVAGELSYTFQTSATSIHQFSPLILSYNYMQHSTAKFDSIRHANSYVDVAMRDQFVPKMQYTYQYTSPAGYHNPIYWQTTVSEAGNILSLGYLAGGKKWGDDQKKMFKNAYAQFFKIETNWRKIWQLTEKTQVVGHVSAGALWAYGNSMNAPYDEQFYVGGANSIRAFNVRSIGPGRYVAPTGKMSYMDQTGDLKFVANIEYRFPIISNLYGALFLDGGNIWAMHKSETRPNSTFELKHALSDMALGTGVGLRYDLDYFVIRVDWGYGLHVPYDNGYSGYFNMHKFKDAQSIHLAIGYPF